MREFVSELVNAFVKMMADKHMPKIPALSLLVIALLTAFPAHAQIDPAGEWSPRYHEDQPERRPGPEIGDYLGLPITNAARLRGEAWDASLLTVPEHQCKPCLLYTSRCV